MLNDWVLIDDWYWNDFKLYDNEYRDELKDALFDHVKIKKDDDPMKKMGVNPTRINNFYKILRSSDDYKKKAESESDSALGGSNPGKEIEGLINQFYDNLNEFNGE